MTSSWLHGPAGLLNPGLLALGAGLVAVPILIHLFNRRRVQHLPWAAMQWLMSAMKRHQRRLKLENWLILLLRVLAILLLGLALARPVLTNPDLAGLFGGKRSVFVVVDTSYSMGARTQGGRSVADLAKAEADAVLSGLGSEDAVAVVVTNDPRMTLSDGRDSFTLVPRSVATEAAAKAKEAVAALRTRDAPADWAEALLGVRRQMSEEDVNRLVVVVTDLQHFDWREEEVARALTEILHQRAAVRIVDVGGTDRRNLTVAAVKSAAGRDAFVERPLRLDVTIENQGAAEVKGARVSVFLDTDATPMASRALEPILGADAATRQPGRQEVHLDLPGRSFAEPGSHVLRVEVVPPHDDPAADALSLDSRRGFALRVRDRIRVLAWTRTSRTARLAAESYLRGVYERWEVNAVGERVRERSPLYELGTVTSEAALSDALTGQGIAAPDLVVLANAVPRGRALEALRQFVAGGGALLVFVGDALADPGMLNDAFHVDEEHRLLPFPYDAPEVIRDMGTGQPFTIDFENRTGHRLAAPFTGEEAASWIGLVPPAVWGRMPFVVPETDESGRQGRVVLRFADGKAAVVEGAYGLGRTLWVATSVDHGWFERSLFFLPVFLDEAAVYATSPDDARLNLEVGRRIVVTWLPRDAANPRFLVPGGTEVVPTVYAGLGEGERPRLMQDRVGTAGTWRLLYDRGTIRGDLERVEERFAVNPDAGEGRLQRALDEDVQRMVPPESDLQILSSWGEIEEEAAEVRQGEITVPVLWLAIALLLLESILAWMFGRRRRTDGHAGAPVGS